MARVSSGGASGTVDWSDGGILYPAMTVTEIWRLGNVRRMASWEAMLVLWLTGI